jgi:ribonucleoside-diphosphate reductase beta chain
MNKTETLDNKYTQLSYEILLDDKYTRLTALPINDKFKSLWASYKKQQESYWTAEEINFLKDYDDFITLSDNEQHFIKMVLAFFAASDGIVNINLRDRFTKEIKIPEALAAYNWQCMMEQIHGEVYSNMLINIVKDTHECDKLFNAITTIPSIKKISDWAFKWINSDKHIGYRIVAFVIVEGIFFSSAFAAIFWLKDSKKGQLFMEGLVKSNRFISRDEGLHCEFGCLMYSFINNRIPTNEIYEIIKEANEISSEFVINAIQTRLIGINNETMNTYVKYVSDRILIMLGYSKLYNAVNPFKFMDNIGLESKDNFFEMRPDSYSSAFNETNRNWEFKLLTDF